LKELDAKIENVTTSDTDDYRLFADTALNSGHGKNEAKTVGFIDTEILTLLRERRIEPSEATIEILDKQLIHAMRDYKKLIKGTAVSDDDLLRLPEIFAQSQAILFDTEDPALIYVFKTADANYLGKVVVRLNHKINTR